MICLENLTFKCLKLYNKISFEVPILLYEYAIIRDT